MRQASIPQGHPPPQSMPTCRQPVRGGGAGGGAGRALRTRTGRVTSSSSGPTALRTPGCAKTPKFYSSGTPWCRRCSRRGLLGAHAHESQKGSWVRCAHKTITPQSNALHGACSAAAEGSWVRALTSPEALQRKNPRCMRCSRARCPCAKWWQAQGAPPNAYAGTLRCGTW